MLLSTWRYLEMSDIIDLLMYVTLEMIGIGFSSVFND